MNPKIYFTRRKAKRCAEIPLFIRAIPTDGIFRKPKRKEKRLVKSENLERIFGRKRMQTLTAGSFLNLENQGNVEALKFTARRLAEHTAAVVAENLPPAALANLSDNLWEKAEFVARETERRRLREIFTENFTERFRELKPESSLADGLVSEVLSAASTIENGGSATANAPASEIVEDGESKTAATENASSDSPLQAEKIEVQENCDEFLGYVKTDEPFVAATVEEAKTMATTTVSSNVGQKIIQSADSPISETSKSENEQSIAEQDISAEIASAEKSPPSAAAKVPAGNNSQTSNANKTNALEKDAKEPFEFGRCTINLNLVLLPSSGNSASRKAIISASSHGFAPEIEFLEIKEGENLTEIAELVRGKLAAFKNGLPAKYIEQLRQSKTNRAKKAAPAKASTAAASDKSEADQSNIEKTSGSQTAQSPGSKNGESRTEVAATNETAAAKPSAMPTAVPPSPPAANNLQPSLF